MALELLNLKRHNESNTKNPGYREKEEDDNNKARPSFHIAYSPSTNYKRRVDFGCDTIILLKIFSYTFDLAPYLTEGGDSEGLSFGGMPRFLHAWSGGESFRLPSPHVRGRFA